jgi:hypothetical protein
VFADNLKQMKKTTSEMMDFGFIPISNPFSKGNKLVIIMCLYQTQNKIN